VGDPETDPPAAPSSESSERGLDPERSLTARLQALAELTRMPTRADDEAAVAQHLLERIVSVLGAAAGSVARIEDDRLIGLAALRIPPTFAELQARRPASDWGFHQRFANGTIAYIAPIEPGSVSQAILDAARVIGLRTYAAFSIRDEGSLRGVLIAAFRQPASELPYDQRTIEAIGRVIDISFANQRLRRGALASEERYRVVFEQSPDALLVETVDNVVVDANPAARRMFGDDVVGRAPIDLALIDDDAAEQGLRQVARQGTSRWTGVGHRPDGGTFPVEVDGTRIQIAGEERILALVRDTTERQRIEQELLQAQKMEAIGLLVAGVAHELNNPLASIVAFSQLIRTDPRLPAELHHHADLLIQESNRTRRIVQNLLDFARQRPPERVPTSLPDLIDRVLDLQSYTFGPSRIEAVLDIPSDLPLVSLDRAQIQQVLINLTLNAAQAIRTKGERGTIHIKAEQAIDTGGGPVVRVTITDDGPGIPEHLHSRVFVPFFTTKAPGEGTGLGLSVSFGIAAGHGGSLRFEPGPRGRGATFILDMPVDHHGNTEATAARPSASVSPAPDSRSVAPRADQAERRAVRVLVLDDEASIRDFLSRILRRNDYEPLVAADGPTAIEIVRTDPPDAILCDHRMAGMSGTAFHDAVSEIQPDLARRFAFMSGDVLNAELREFALARGIPLLAKPFDIETVEQTVSQILAA
jgi:two-component system, NtrC family, sensor kinase